MKTPPSLRKQTGCVSVPRLISYPSGKLSGHYQILFLSGSVLAFPLILFPSGRELKLYLNTKEKIA